MKNAIDRHEDACKDFRWILSFDLFTSKFMMLKPIPNTNVLKNCEEKTPNPNGFHISMVSGA
jgi:hypothetical protein